MTIMFVQRMHQWYTWWYAAVSCCYSRKVSNVTVCTMIPDDLEADLQRSQCTERV